MRGVIFFDRRLKEYAKQEDWLSKLHSDFTKDGHEDKIKKKQKLDSIPFPEPGPPPDLELDEPETRGSSSILPHTEYTAENKYDKKEPDYSAAFSQKQRRYREAICERYNANVELEKAYFEEKREDGDADRHINGQALGKLGMMSFGPTINETVSSPVIESAVKSFNRRVSGYDFGTAGNAVCEAVAIYNTLYDLGSEISLSQIIYDIEFTNSTVWHGWFGTNVYQIDDILKAYGVSSHKVYSPRIQDAAENGKIDEGQIFIASIYNNRNGGVFSGIHTFEIVYSPLADNEPQWIVYNRFSNEQDPKLYQNLQDVLCGGEYVIIYQIDG